MLEGGDRPRATGDSGKTIGARTYGTDAGVAGESQSGDWRNIGILLAFVEHFSIQNVALHDSHCWAISLERYAHATLRDIDFQSSGFKTIDGKRLTILTRTGSIFAWGATIFSSRTSAQFSANSMLSSLHLRPVYLMR